MQSVIRQFPIAMGIVEGSDPKTLPPGTLTSLVNGVWRKENRVDKRYGTQGLTKNIVGGGTLGAAARLLIRGQELCLIDGANIHSYSSHLGEWVRVDQAPDVGISWSTLNDTHGGIASMDIAYASGLIVHAWVSGDPTQSEALGTGNVGSSYVQVTDESGGVLLSSRLATSSKRVRVLIIGTTAILVYYDSNAIVARTLDLSTLTLSNQSTLRNDPRTTWATFDACVIGSNFVVAYENNANALKLYSYNTSLAQQATGGITGEAGNGILCVSIDGAAGEVLYVAYCVDSTSKTRIAIANPSTLAQTVAPVDLAAATEARQIGVRRLDASNCVVGYHVADFSGLPSATTTWKVSSAAVIDTNSQRGTWAARMVSRPFLIGARAFMLLADWDNRDSVAPLGPFTGANTYLVEIETSTIGSAGNNCPHRYLGKIDVLIGGTTIDGSLSNVVAVSATKLYAAVPFLATAPAHPTVWRCGARLVTLTAGADLPSDFWRTVQLGDESYVAAGTLHAYDGSLLFDYGFARQPSIIDVVQAGGAISGVYLWSFGQEYRSTAGMLHRSPIGTVISSYNLAAKQATLKVSVGGLTLKTDLATGYGAERRPLMSVTYRTVGSGTTFYRLTYEPRANVLTIDPRSRTQDLIDNRTDASIDGSGTPLSTQPVVYTTGGELDDFQPPSSLALMTHQNRLWSLAGDRRTVWISKDYISNPGIAPGFHPTVTLTSATDLTTFGSLDDKAVLFSADRVWVVLGSGPAPDGNGSDYAIVPVHSVVGCINPRSLVGMPDGLVFLSARGFYLLDRGLNLTRIGSPVEDTLATFPNVTSAVLVPAQKQVRWTCNNAAGTAGRTIVFDYETKQWSVFRHWDSDAGVDGTPITDALMWNGAWTFVTPTGKVYREDTTTHLDDGSRWVKQSGEIAWISESGPLGFQHVRRAFLLGDRLTDCDLTLRFGFNHATSYAQSYTWASDKLAQFGDGANVGMRVGSQNGASPRCRAFRLAWEDAAPTGAGAVMGMGEGVNLSAIGIEFIPKPDMGRRSARART